MAINQSDLKAVVKTSLDEILETKLASLRDEIFETKFASLLDQKLNPLITSLNFISDGFDEMREKIGGLEKSNKELVKENQILKQEMARLSNSITQIKMEVDEQEQYTRRECLELKGIPVTAEENTDEIVSKIGSLIDVEINEEDISVSHRLQSKARNNRESTQQTLIVKFVSRRTRDALYRARSKLKNFTVGDIGLGRQGNSKIYIQESLTQTKRDLFQKCLQFKKEKKFRYIWSNYGTIFMRKDDHSRSIKISSHKDLRKLEPGSFSDTELLSFRAARSSFANASPEPPE